jgi:hypothetical protein
VAAFIRVPPSYTFHVVGMNDDHHVAHIEDVKQTGLWLNGGYVVFRPEIFDYLHEARSWYTSRSSGSYEHHGFWARMETGQGAPDAGGDVRGRPPRGGLAAAGSGAGVIELPLPRAGDWGLRVLAIGAHSDDIEIGCGGTVLRLVDDDTPIERAGLVGAVLEFRDVGRASAEVAAAMALEQARRSTRLLRASPAGDGGGERRGGHQAAELPVVSRS